MGGADWIGTDALASLAGISPQKARSALHRSLIGHTWRGAVLVVRTVPGRGGRSGLRYEVRVDSLPLDLQLRHRQLTAAELDPSVLRSDEAASEWRTWWAVTLGPALAHRRRSQERASEIAALAGHMHFTPDGLSRLYDERTLRRWLARFEAGGAAGLHKRARRDRGRRRIIISARWDQAVAFDEPTRQRIAGEILDKVRRLWRSGYVLSKVIRYASEELLKLTQGAGFEGGHRELRRVCELPRGFVQPYRHLAKVARYERDRKAHEDAKPRVTRTIEGLSPFALVFGDVHPLDIVVRREDGRTAWPRLIAWYDAATHLIFVTVVLPEVNPKTGRMLGITNADVIASFIAMATHWGLPRRLYLDNGKEFNFADFIADAMELIGKGLDDIDAFDGRGPVIRAKPYNAAAKTIEGIFGVLERNYFSEIPGWTGGDRTNQKTANVGREPDPFPGTIGELTDLIQAHLQVYHSQPQRGALKGQSPRQALQAAIDAGWRRVEIDPRALRLPFSTEEPRSVIQGRISARGQNWTCPELLDYLGRKVSVRLPKYEDWLELPVHGDDGRLLGYAVPDTPFHMLDRKGSREASRREGRQRAEIVRLGKSILRINPIEQVLASAAIAGPLPAMPSDGVVTMSGEATELGRRLAETPNQRRDRRAEEASRRQAERLAIIDREKKRRSHG